MLGQACKQMPDWVVVLVYSFTVAVITVMSLAEAPVMPLSFMNIHYSLFITHYSSHRVDH